MDDDERELAQAVGAEIRRARGSMDRTEAARRSGVSVSWWLESEKGLRLPRPGKIVQALTGIGVDPTRALLAGAYEPGEYAADIAAVRDRARGDAGGQVTQLLTDIAAELRGLREEVHRLGDAYEQLAAPAVAPPSTASPPPRRETRAAPTKQPSTRR